MFSSFLRDESIYDSEMMAFVLGKYWAVALFLP